MLRSILSIALGQRAPIAEGTLHLPGLHAATTVRRDANGITYVDASNDEDAFFAMGFCQARDRSFQMELHLRVARGTLAEVLGEEMLPVDRLMRRIGFLHIARRQLALLAPRERAQLESFGRAVAGKRETQRNSFESAAETDATIEMIERRASTAPGAPSEAGVAGAPKSILARVFNR